MSIPSARSLRQRIAAFVRAAFSVDLRSLALLRLVLGGLLISDLWDRVRWVDVLYSNDGVLSNHFSLFRPLAPFQFSFYVGASSAREVTVAFAATFIIYFLFTIGYRTRLFHFLSFVCVTSLHSRNLMSELPSDAPLHLWLAWSLFLPLGARLSVDALRRSFAAPSDLAPETLNVRNQAPVAVTSVAVVGMLLQLSAIHLVSAVRQSGATWQDGSALYYALRQNLWVTDLGSWVSRNLSAGDLRTLSFGYRAAEVLIAALVLVPIPFARRAAIASLFAFHGISRLLWNFGAYEGVVLAATPMLLTSRDWDAFRAWYRATKPKLTIHFDSESGLLVQSCRLLRRLDVLSCLTFVPVSPAPQAGKAFFVDEPRSGTLVGARAASRILGALPLGRPLGLLLRLPGVSWAAQRVLDLLDTRRIAIGAWFGMKTFEKLRDAALPVARPAVGPLARFVVPSREAACLLFALISGLALARDMGDERVPSGVEAAVYRVVAYPRLFQRWGLFAPDPPKRLGTLVADAQTASGARLDPLMGTPRTTSLEVPARPPDPLMAAYFTSIGQPARATYVAEFRDYLRRVGEGRGPSERLVWFNVDWIEAPIAEPEGTPTPATELALAPASRRITSGP